MLPANDPPADNRADQRTHVHTTRGTLMAVAVTAVRGSAFRRYGGALYANRHANVRPALAKGLSNAPSRFGATLPSHGLAASRTVNTPRDFYFANVGGERRVGGGVPQSSALPPSNPTASRAAHFGKVAFAAFSGWLAGAVELVAASFFCLACSNCHPLL